VDRSKHVGGVPEVVERQLEKQPLAPFALIDLRADGAVVVAVVLDGVVEDRGVRGEPRDPELIDIALQRAAREPPAA
jgi:hypothetical protein